MIYLLNGLYEDVSDIFLESFVIIKFSTSFAVIFSKALNNVISAVHLRYPWEINKYPLPKSWTPLHKIPGYGATNGVKNNAALVYPNGLSSIFGKYPSWKCPDITKSVTLLKSEIALNTPSLVICSGLWVSNIL